MKRAIAVLFLLAVAIPLIAQVKTGTIVGRVTDTDGAPLPGVSVEALVDGEAPNASTVTDTEGRYRLPNMPVGIYDLVFKKTGFKACRYSRYRGYLDGIHLRGNETVAVNAILELAALGDEPLLDIKRNKPVFRAPLVRGEPVDVFEKEGVTPLHGAAGVLSEAERLIKAGANVNARTFDGWTPLHFAAHEGCLEVAELFLLRGAQVNARDDCGWTPLHSAGISGSADVANVLLRWEASAHSKTVDGWTPLHVALENGHEEIANLFIASGADVNAKTASGLTPLHCLALSEDWMEDMAKLLVICGADVEAKDLDGRTPLHLAVAREYSFHLVELLVERGADVKAKTASGLTPLHCLALSEDGDADVAELLIDHGADVNAKDREGRTPLFLAEKAGHTELVELLVKRGARR